MPINSFSDIYSHGPNWEVIESGTKPTFLFLSQDVFDNTPSRTTYGMDSSGQQISVTDTIRTASYTTSGPGQKCPYVTLLVIVWFGIRIHKHDPRSEETSLYKTPGRKSSHLTEGAFLEVDLWKVQPWTWVNKQASSNHFCCRLSLLCIDSFCATSVATFRKWKGFYLHCNILVRLIKFR